MNNNQRLSKNKRPLVKRKGPFYYVRPDAILSAIDLTQNTIFEKKAKSCNG